MRSLLVGACSAALLLTPRPLGLAPSMVPWPRGRGKLAMELRMPEDSTTIDRFIQRTKDNLQEALVVVLHFNDPSAPPNAWDFTYAASSTSSTEQMFEIAKEYSGSERRGGRPLIVLQIDRDMVGMDAICSARGIVTFPTIQLWSRGQGEVVKLGELEQRLLSLGVVPVTAAARETSGRVGSAGRLLLNEDLFGVGSGGAELTRASAERAMARTPRQANRKAARATDALPDTDGDLEAELIAELEGASDGDSAAPPAVDGDEEVLARGVEDATVEAALDVLFAEPDWDDDDMPPPI